MNGLAKKLYAALHIGIGIVLLAFPLLRELAARLPKWMSGCFFHDFLHLYCPFCGGTRAVESLLRLDFLNALRCNAFVVLLVFGFLCWDGRALVRLLRKKTAWWSLPVWCWGVLIAVFLGFGIARNLLMIFLNFDPLGDLTRFWLR